MVALFVSDENAEESDTDNDWPENGGLLSQLEGVAQSKSKKSSSSTTEKCDTIFQGIGEKDTKNESSDGAETKNEPVDPHFALMLHEKRIKDEQENEGGGDESDQKHGWLDALASNEVDEETDDDHDGTIKEGILVKEDENLVNIQSWTGISCTHGELLNASVWSIPEEFKILNFTGRDGLVAVNEDFEPILSTITLIVRAFESK